MNRANLNTPTPDPTKLDPAKISTNSALVSSLSENLRTVLARLASAAERSGTEHSTAGRLNEKNPQDTPVELIAVSKTQSSEKIAAFYDLGLRDFGENYAQEFKEKAIALSHLNGLRWHYIGNLQTNKLKDVLPFCHFIHSLNRFELLLAMEKKILAGVRPAHLEKVKLFVQLQVDENDAGKSGAGLAEAEKICSYLATCESFQWIGFMGMGPAEANDALLRNLYNNFFHRAEKLWKRYNTNATHSKPLISLGMSNDLDVAVACGSTTVRIGTALFGERVARAQGI